MYFFELWICQVSVNLGGGYIGMSEHFLHAAQIGAVSEEVRSKGVTQGVRCDLLGDTGLDAVFFDDTLNTPCGEPCSGFVVV